MCTLLWQSVPSSHPPEPHRKDPVPCLARLIPCNTRLIPCNTRVLPYRRATVHALADSRLCRCLSLTLSRSLGCSACLIHPCLLSFTPLSLVSYTDMPKSQAPMSHPPLSLSCYNYLERPTTFLEPRLFESKDPLYERTLVAAAPFAPACPCPGRVDHTDCVARGWRVRGNKRCGRARCFLWKLRQEVRGKGCLSGWDGV